MLGVNFLLSTIQRQAKLVHRFCVVTRYTNEHEWVSFNLEKSVAKVGITDFAQSELGDIVHIESPKVGLKFKKSNSVGAIESVKVAADIYAPISGEIIAVNDEVKENPSLINEDAEKHWIFETGIDSTNTTEFDNLMDKDQYVEFLKNLVH